jgi:hypothetical protein
MALKILAQMSVPVRTLASMKAAECEQQEVFVVHTALSPCCAAARVGDAENQAIVRNKVVNNIG